MNGFHLIGRNWLKAVKFINWFCHCGLLAFAGRTALARYGPYACVSLVPKTALKKHYMKKYGMLDAGWQLYLDLDALNNIVAKYTL